MMIPSGQQLRRRCSQQLGTLYFFLKICGAGAAGRPTIFLAGAALKCPIFKYFALLTPSKEVGAGIALIQNRSIFVRVRLQHVQNFGSSSYSFHHIPVPVQYSTGTGMLEKSRSFRFRKF
jgi:hypothetical protein